MENSNSRPLVVVWRVTELCNLGCRFCGYSRHLRWPRQAAHPEQVLAFGALLRDYQAESGRDVLVSWLGGEPLLWPPLMELSHTFKQEFKLHLGVTTNGTRLDSARIRERIVNDYDQITISLDGVEDWHDSYRDAPGLYARLGATIRKLRQARADTGHGPLIRVSTILTRENLAGFEALCRDCAAWGVEELTFNPLGGQSRPDFYAGHCLLPEHISWFVQELPRLREQMAQMGLKICGGQDYSNRIVSSIRGIPVPVADCKPGVQFLFIDERGLVGPCSFTLHRYGYPLAGFKSVQDLVRLPARLAERKRSEMLTPCRDCLSTQVFGKFA